MTDPQNRRSAAAGPFVQTADARPAPVRRGPVIITDDLEPLAETPAEALPPDDAEHPAGDGAAARAIKAAAGGRGSVLGGLFWAAVAGLVGLGLSVAAWDFVAGLVTRNPVLGTAAGVLSAVVALGLLLFVVRELIATARLGRVDAIREGAVQAVEAGDHARSAQTVRALRRLYRGRRDMDWGMAQLRGREGDVLDAAALIAEAETALMTPLDPRAEATVAAAARSVAMITALVPVTLIDVLSALAINLRMIRSVAEIYGGRAGWLGSWRLLKAVAGHLIATGVVAMGDDLLGPLVGGGVLAKLSRRFGEGLVNGALTARVGAAAIEVCRPLPFSVRPKPSPRALVARALTSLADRGAADARPQA
jgi:putative membrane protein